jgi:hypothetical protein
MKAKGVFYIMSEGEKKHAFTDQGLALITTVVKKRSGHGSSDSFFALWRSLAGIFFKKMFGFILDKI